MSQINVITYHANWQAAEALADAGIPVFPFELVPDPRPGKSPRKKPSITDWRAKAATDKAQIRRWFAKHPERMPGIPMGHRTGLAVLDVDQKNGKDGFAELRAMGLDPEALSPVIVQSPGGSLHLYFRWPEGMGNSAEGLPPGLDVRGEGGYVAAPGATHEGGSYSILKGGLTNPVPDWPEALRPRQRAKDANDGQPTGLPFHVILSALAALPNDGDDFASRDAWLAIGMALHSESDGSEEGREAWHNWSRQWSGYDDVATDAAWESFHAGGGMTGWTIIREAEKRGWSDAALTALRDMEALEDFYLIPTAEEDAEIDALVDGPKDDDGTAAKPSGLTFLTPAECAALPARPYVIKGLLAQGDVAAIIGAPGVGKSLLAPRLAYAVAQGAEVFGRRTKAGAVWYVAAEDEHGMRARLSALRADLGDTDALHLVRGVSDLLSDGGQLKSLRAAVKAQRPSLIFIDTLAVAFPGLEENSAEGMGKVVAAARSLARWGAAVVLIHHDTKAGDGLPRGHSLLNGALDMSLALIKGENGLVTGRMSKNRNGPSDGALAFTIATRRLGTDEDGDPITTAVCEEADASAAKSKAAKLTGQQKVAFELLAGLNAGQASVTKSDWRKACQESAAFSASDDHRGKNTAFRRAVEELTRKGHVTEMEGDAFAIVNPYGDFTADFPEEGPSDDLQ